MTVRVGVIGCGTIACWAHLPALRRIADATLVAVADPDPGARSRAARLVAGAAYERAGELLDRPDIDAVVITAPPSTHAHLTTAAARAGKHVYVEKPLAIEIAGAREAIDAVARSGVVGAMGFNYRRHPAHERARAWLAAGRIGEVRAVQTIFCERLADAGMPDWKRRRGSGGGALLDLASHHIDLIRWFLHDEIAAVDATVVSRTTEDDTATLVLTTGGGVPVETFVSFCAGTADSLTFVGENGTIRVDRHAATAVLHTNLRRRYGLRRRWTAPTAAESLIRARRLVQRSFEPSFARSLRAFVAHVGGASVALPTLEDGASSLAVVLAAEESSRQKRLVTIT